MSPIEFGILRSIFFIGLALSLLVVIPLVQGRSYFDWRKRTRTELPSIVYLLSTGSGRSFGLFDLLGVFALLFVFSQKYFLGWTEQGSADVDLPINQVLLINMAFQLVLMLIVLIRLSRTVKGMKLELGLKPLKVRRSLGFVPIVLLGAWAFAGLLQVCGWQEWVEEFAGGGVQEVVRRLANVSDRLTLILFILSATVVAPLTEELIFRGYFFGVFRDLVGPIFGMVASGFFFAMAHGNLFSLPVLFFFGVLLALAYHRSKTIWIPIVCHALFNAFTVWIQLTFSR